MDEKAKEQIAMHVAGTTVRHNAPFEALKAYRNETQIDNAFIEKWVIPFYMNGLRPEEEICAAYRQCIPQLTDSILLRLFGEFNWRPRISGAYFAAITRNTGFEEIIGTHLLKSEVCYAGCGYCIAFAAFETNRAQQYLIEYLNYYLKRVDLDFDQSCAIGALAYLDGLHESDFFDEVKPAYEKWRTQAPHRSSVEEAVAHFDSQMKNLEVIRQSVCP